MKKYLSIGFGLAAFAVFWLLMGAAAPMPVLRNKWTTNTANSAPIIGDWNYSNSTGVNFTNFLRFDRFGVGAPDLFGGDIWKLYGQGGVSAFTYGQGAAGRLETNGSHIMTITVPNVNGIKLQEATGAYFDPILINDASGNPLISFRTNGFIFSAAWTRSAGAWIDSKTNLVAAFVTNLTWASTVDVNFDLGPYQYLIMTNNTTFTSSQLGAGKAVALKIFAGTTNYVPTWPTWKFIGAGAPTLIASNKTAILSVTAWDGNTTNVVAAYAVEP